MKKHLLLLATVGLMTFACSTKKSSTDQMTKSELLSTPIELFIGTYTDEDSEGVYSAAFNPQTGALANLKLLVKSPSPSYLALNRDERLVYAVNELNKGTLSAFVQKEDSLWLINEKQTQGIHPCYVGLDGSGTMAAVANYSSGDGAVFNVLADGSLGDTVFTYQHEGSGPNTKRQEAPHAHCSIFSSDGRFVYVVDLGTDQVMAYPTFGEELGRGFVALQLAPGDGPRHLIFHPDMPQAFVINELSNSVVSAAVDPVSGVFTGIDRESTIPEDFSAHSQCADIHLSGDGKFLYGSNRGHNSIAIFKVAMDGGLERIATEPVQGEWPRNFTFSPDERFLLVANKDTDNITVFERNTETGLLKYTGQSLSISKPVCLKFN